MSMCLFGILFYPELEAFHNNYIEKFLKNWK